MRVVVLGSTGMLGQRVCETLDSQGYQIVRVSRSEGVTFDFEEERFAIFASSIGLLGEDWVVNCVGWIPQKSAGDSEKDRLRAFRLNSELPEQISQSQSKIGFGWIQIATDCVFDGLEGKYDEDSVKAATDLYSESKISGERFTAGAVQVRTSIIGVDRKGQSGLYEWFRGLTEGAKVEGYVGHLWNGVTTNAFARLVAGLIANGMRDPMTHHWLPLDAASKYELLLLFKKHLHRADIKVETVERRPALDRRLKSKNLEQNVRLWEIAGYSRPQTIEELVIQMIESDTRERITN
jgi:dTDP-4-dehydrorhamnose reductase